MTTSTFSRIAARFCSPRDSVCRIPDSAGREWLTPERKTVNRSEYGLHDPGQNKRFLQCPARTAERAWQQLCSVKMLPMSSSCFVQICVQDLQAVCRLSSRGKVLTGTEMGTRLNIHYTTTRSIDFFVEL